MWSLRSRRILRLLWYHKLFIILTIATLLLMFGYHVAYHTKRIVSQRLYMLGMNRVHGNSLKPLDTYAFDNLLHGPVRVHNATSSVYLLIIISSSPHDRIHRELRETIRTTWGDLENIKSSTHGQKYVQNFTCKLLFYMGLSRLQAQNDANLAELNKYNDIIIGDFLDDYHNMTRKILFGLKWATKMFHSNYILKTDDDVFMNIPRLMHLLHTKYSHVKELYGGHVYYASIIRDKNHKHFVTYEELPDHWYPPYNKGGILILSGHLIEAILRVSTQMTRFQIDDAYIGLLMNRIGVRPITIKEIALSQWFTYFVEWISTCDLKSLVGIGDNITPIQMTYLFKLVNRKTSWYCIQLDALLSYCLFLFFFVFAVFFFMRQRYCPWLTVAVVKNSINIFRQRINK